MSSEFLSKAGESSKSGGVSGHGTKSILENKWTAVIRLKKQNMELEKQNKELKES